MIPQGLCAQPQVECVAECVADQTTITFTAGRIDGEENFIIRELQGLTDGLGRCLLFLDLRHVKGLSSAEVGTLVFLHKKLKAAGGRLTLVNLSVRLREVFARTKLNTFLDIREAKRDTKHQPEATQGTKCGIPSR
jgi:anti-anti-sigma factor